MPMAKAFLRIAASKIVPLPDPRSINKSDAFKVYSFEKVSSRSFLRVGTNGAPVNEVNKKTATIRIMTEIIT